MGEKKTELEQLDSELRQRVQKEPQTSKDVRPDYESGRGYYWMKQMYHLRKDGTPLSNWPRKPRRTAAEKEFFGQVDRRLSRNTYSLGHIKDGKLIKEED